MKKEKINTEKVFESVIKYLKLVSSDIYELPGRFTEEDEKEIIKAGFKPEICSFYDGKILKVTDENIATHSTKCQCIHSVYLKENTGGKYHFDFHVVEADRRWSIDPVYEEKRKDDSIEDNYFVLEKNSVDVLIGKIEDLKDIPAGIKKLFLMFKKHISENHKDLRLRLHISED